MASLDLSMSNILVAVACCVLHTLCEADGSVKEEAK